MTTPFYLFGAGASAYCGQGVTPKAPPMANGLFDELADNYSFFRKIDPETASVFRQDFEQGMAVWLNRHKAQEPMFRLKMAHYFLKFQITERSLKNYYVAFWYWASVSHDCFLVASLNYDLLLEDSWQLLKGKTCWQKALKLHGAANFVPPAGIHISRSTFDARDANTIMDIQVVSRKEALAFCENNDSVGPSMSMVAIGKHVPDSPHFVLQQQMTFERDLKNTDRLIIVGVKFHEQDTHLWSVIAAAKKPIGIVNPDFADYQSWGSRNGLRIHHICGTFEEFVQTARYFEDQNWG